MKLENEVSMLLYRDLFIIQCTKHERAAGIDYRLIDPQLMKLMRGLREHAFEEGWYSREQLLDEEGAVAPRIKRPKPKPKPSPKPKPVDDERMWVNSMAIVEDLATGELFVDPRFPVRRAPTDRCCVELVRTSEGLVARGPPNHRPRRCEIDRERLRPLVRFDRAPAR